MGSEDKTAKHPKSRLFGLAALSGFVALIGYASHEGYRAATDAFVAPIILSPDNDLVLANKVKVSELQVERAKTAAEIEALDADVESAEQALARLSVLREATEGALEWTKGQTERQARASASELRTLRQQRDALKELLGEQVRVTEQVRANMSAGLVSKLDLAREEQATGRWRVALIETERSAQQTEGILGQLAEAKRALSAGGPRMPEQVARDEQLVRIELEEMKLRSEQRSKRAERRVLAEKMRLIVEVDRQLKARPIIRALEQSMDVAFVPYTQIDGMRSGADVYDCVWGIFHCRQVGKVAEVVPGEVILPDPWGNQARGQYAVLELREHESAKSKTLRVRGGGLPAREVTASATSAGAAATAVAAVK